MTESRFLTYFEGAAGKRLSAVEVDPDRSHQRELNGVLALQAILGDPGGEKHRLEATYVWIDDVGDVQVANGTATWYDARFNHPTRTELRLYFTTNAVMARAGEGDYLVIATRSRPDGTTSLVFVLAPMGSSTELQLMHLFGLADTGSLFDVSEELPAAPDFTSRVLLEALGFEEPEADPSLLEIVRSRYPSGFPTTNELSMLARELCTIDALADPDGALSEWFDKEEILFRTVEREIVSAELSEAGGDIDRTLEVAMRTFQRRKSRAGHALENHFAALLTQHGVSFERGKTTEGHKKPDFLVPSQLAYLDFSRPIDTLAMVGVKTTCKDRWRQVLSEAERLPRKYLLTLEAPISENQLAEMWNSGIDLVVPVHSHELFPAVDQGRPNSVRWLIEQLRVAQ